MINKIISLPMDELLITFFFINEIEYKEGHQEVAAPMDL